MTETMLGKFRLNLWQERTCSSEWKGFGQIKFCEAKSIWKVDEHFLQQKDMFEL